MTGRELIWGRSRIEVSFRLVSGNAVDPRMRTTLFHYPATFAEKIFIAACGGRGYRKKESEERQIIKIRNAIAAGLNPNMTCALIDSTDYDPSKERFIATQVIIDDNASVPEIRRRDTLVNIALKAKMPKVVHELLIHGSRPEIYPGSESPLNLAMQLDDPLPSIKLLLRYGAEVNPERGGFSGKPPLARALEIKDPQKRFQIIATLLIHGANPVYRDREDCLVAINHAIEVVDRKLLAALLIFSPDPQKLSDEEYDELHGFIPASPGIREMRRLLFHRLVLAGPALSGETFSLEMAQRLFAATHGDFSEMRKRISKKDNDEELRHQMLALLPKSRPAAFLTHYRCRFFRRIVDCDVEGLPIDELKGSGDVSKLRLI